MTNEESAPSSQRDISSPKSLTTTTTTTRAHRRANVDKQNIDLPIFFCDWNTATWKAATWNAAIDFLFLVFWDWSFGD